MIRLLDAVATWIDRVFTPQIQKRVGAFMFVGSLGLYPLYFATSEPPLIYYMSAFAITATGWGVVITAQTLDEVTEDTDRLLEDNDTRG